MFMPSSAIELKVNGPVGTIVLNRPARRNALSRSMVAQLQQALGDLQHEKRVRAIILTGAGDAFCAGLDVHEMHSDGTLPEAERDRRFRAPAPGSS